MRFSEIKKEKFIINNDGQNIYIDNSNIHSLEINLKEKIIITINNSNIEELIINAQSRFKLEFDYIKTIKFTNVISDIFIGKFDKLFCDSYKKSTIRSILISNITSYIQNKEIIDYHYESGQIELSDCNKYLENNGYIHSDGLIIDSLIANEYFSYISKEPNQKLLIKNTSKFESFSLKSNNAILKNNGFISNFYLYGDCQFSSDNPLITRFKDIILTNTINIPDNLKPLVSFLHYSESSSSIDLSSFDNLIQLHLTDGSFTIKDKLSLINKVVIKKSTVILDDLQIQELELTNSILKGKYSASFLEADIASLNNYEIKKNSIGHLTLKKFFKGNENFVSLKDNFELCKMFNIPFLEDNILSQSI